MRFKLKMYYGIVIEPHPHRCCRVEFNKHLYLFNDSLMYLKSRYITIVKSILMCEKHFDEVEG